LKFLKKFRTFPESGLVVVDAREARINNHKLP
jgi:hypothetical protein